MYNYSQNRKVRLSATFSILFIFAFLGAILAGCTKKQAERTPNTFNTYEKDDVKTWDPANAYDTVSLDLVPNIYETLYQYSYLADTYKIEPLLAADLPKYSKNRLTLTIPIKKGIRFQDDPCFKETGGKGRELKAQDFIYALKRMALPSLQSQGFWVIDDEVVGMKAFHEKLSKAQKADIPKIFEEPIEGLKALDDYTLQIKLYKPYPTLKYILTMSFTSPVAREAVDAYGDSRGNLLDHPVGTGPYKLVKWERNHHIVLDRNPNFRGESYPSQGAEEYRKIGLLVDAGKKIPFVERISVDIIKEDQPRWLNFMKGNTDITRLPKDNFRQAITEQGTLTPELAKKGIKLSVETGVVIRYISFNMKDKILGSNKYLRQALSAAIDREKWVNIFTNGTGKKMVSAIPPGIADRPKTSRIKYDYNLEQAKELLKKAGYPNGQGLPPIKFELRGASTTDRQLGDFFAQQFAQIGVKLEVVPNTFPAFLEKQKQGALQTSFGGWAMDFPDAENIYQLLYGPNMSPGPGESNYDNPEFNKLYEKIATMESGPQRAKLFQQMDDLIQEDCPWAMGYYEADYDLSQPWFHNYRATQIILNKYKYFRVSPQGQDL